MGRFELSGSVNPGVWITDEETDIELQVREGNLELMCNLQEKFGIDAPQNSGHLASSVESIIWAITGWRRVCGPDGEELECTEGIKRQLVLGDTRFANAAARCMAKRAAMGDTPAEESAKN